MMLMVHILSKELTYIKLKIVLCSLQDIHELMNFSCQPPTLIVTLYFFTLTAQYRNSLQKTLVHTLSI